MFTISGYTITAQLYESAHSIIYRARRQADELPVVLKVLRAEHPSPEELARLEREYELTHSLNPSTALRQGAEQDSGPAVAGVIRAYALESSQNALAIVLEDFGGEALTRLGLAGQLDLPALLTLAIKIATILGQVHQRHIIHKDLNPSNIILNPATGQLKLIDFGIAAQLDVKIHHLGNPEALEGTLAYISPEQTGRMNRVVDRRTDLYALGVTLYELLTGQLPFAAADIVTLVYDHLATQPAPPDRIKPEIPPILAAIVMKLLAKTPEERYQTAFGVKADLERCLQSVNQDLAGLGNLASLHFQLAQQDVSDRLQIPDKLYGRETESYLLTQTFDRVCTEAQPEVLLVAGAAGTGKSSLVYELHKPIAKTRGLFLSGKFDQLQRNVPYYAVRQVFDELATLLLTEPEAALQHWRRRILNAVGNLGQVLLGVIPRLQLVLGGQPAVAAVGPQETQNRFQMVFQNFVTALAQPDHPLVIFLDDLQWADAASFVFLKTFLIDPQLRHVLLILAYRDNEVLPGHPFLTLLADLQQAEIPITALPVANLDRVQVNALLAETFACEPAQTQPLAEALTAQTDGNAFFTRQLLSAWHDGELIWFDGKQRRWDWDLAQIRSRDVSADVVALMQQKLQRLPAATQDVLSLAACIGNTFDLALLALIYEHSLEDTLADLWPALQAQVLLPLDAQYQYAAVQPERGQFQFLHDRVQQGAYDGIGAERKAAVHLQIGRILKQYITADHQEDHLFDLVHHLNRGREVMTDVAERQDLANLNLHAGKKALGAAAYQAASEFFRQGADLLPEHAWETRYPLTLALHTGWAEAAYMARDFAEAERLFDVTLSRAQTPLERVPVYLLQIEYYWSQNINIIRSIEIGRIALAELGIHLPARYLKVTALLELIKVKLALRGRKLRNAFRLPPMTDAVQQAAMLILFRLMGPISNGFPDLYPLLALRMVRLSLRYGNSPFSGVGYGVYGLLLLTIRLGNVDDVYAVIQDGLRLTNQPEMQTGAYIQWFGYAIYAAHHKEPLHATWTHFQQTMTLCLETGDLNYYGYTLYLYLNYRFLSGIPLGVLLEEFTHLTPVVQKFRLAQVDSYVSVWQQLALTLSGAGTIPWKLAGPIWDETRDLPSGQGAGKPSELFFDYYFAELWLAWLTEDWRAGLAYARKLEAWRLTAAASVHGYYIDLLSGICAATQATTASGPERLRLLFQLWRCCRQFRKMAQSCAANYRHKYLLLTAERARLRGKISQAMALYDEAIAGAREQQFLHEEAMANECAARFYLQLGRENFAAQYLYAARDAYTRWGCLPKVQLLEEKYSHLLARPVPVVNAHEFRPEAITPGIAAPAVKIRTETFAAKGSVLDVATLLKASQILAEEVHLDQLLRQIMALMLENAGAERGVLLLKEDGEWEIQAHGSPAHGIQVLQRLPLRAVADQPDRFLAPGIVDYVSRTGESLVLADACQDRRFGREAYIQQYQVKSLLCQPLLHQGQVAGILYLENNLTTGAFTPERLELLSILSSRAAISLENARLYAELAEANRFLEQRVAERTRDLEAGNRALLQAQALAETASQAKSAFLAHVSHELRTPLNSILGYTQLLRRDQGLTAKHQETIATIHRSGEHLLLLINDLLDLSKIEAQKIELTPGSFPLSKFLHNLVETARMRARTKGLPVDAEIPADLPAGVYADERRLRQILINLLNNAVKFTAQGRVTLRVREVGGWGDRELGRTAPPTPHYPNALSLQLRFEVEDTGIGIPADQLDKIFLPFYQVDARATPEGSGLGLPISQQLVRLMGGELFVKSTVGQGSTFWFDLGLPVANEVVAAAAPPDRRIIGFTGVPRKILLVDDNAGNRAFLRDALFLLGFELREAVNGQEAVEMAQTWQPQLILMDLLMPIMGGFEATRRIRTFAPQPVIIGVSASVLESVRQDSFAAGCDDFLAKPVRIEELLECLRQHLGLEWIYTNPVGTVSESEPPPVSEPGPLAIPPSTLLAELLQFAEDGYITDIQQSVASMKALDANFIPFAARIEQLAENFQFDQMIALINFALKEGKI